MRCSIAPMTAWFFALAAVLVLASSAAAQSGGDYDGDGDVDGDDFWYWSGCMTGPAGSLPDPNCAAFDFDGGPTRDGTVDLADFTAFGRVFDTRKVPLAGDLIASTIDGARFKVYVPTKWGGVLTVSTTSGTVDDLKYPDGTPFANGTETGENKHGWYTFQVNGSTAYYVSATFVQTGQAGTRPWDFYYWPKKGEYICEPRLNGNGVADTTALATDEQVIPPGYPAAPGADIVRWGSDDGNLETTPVPDDQKVYLYALYRRINPWRPLDKYEQWNGGYPRNWEALNDRSNDDWAGHCLGASMASILLDQPTPAAGTPFLQDELEGLWAELGENDAPGAWEYKSGHWFPPPSVIPAGPPAPGWDPTDEWVARIHARFEECVRHEHVALQSNLRAAPDPNYPDWPLDPDAVWNHGVYKFTAAYAEAPGGDERVVQVVNELTANANYTPPTDDQLDRVFQYTYIIRYLGTGLVDEAWLGADFIVVTGNAHFAPGWMDHVLSGIWEAENPWVLLGEVMSDDNSN